MIRLIIKLYSILILIDGILSFFPETNKIPYRQKLKRLCDFACDPIRKKIPQTLPFDVAPLIVIFLLYLFVAAW
jgi:uncharacterized protein YggT (Ycf19 family)